MPYSSVMFAVHLTLGYLALGLMVLGLLVFGESRRQRKGVVTKGHFTAWESLVTVLLWPLVLSGFDVNSGDSGSS